MRRKSVRINRERIILTVIVVILIAVVSMSVKNIFNLRAEQKALTAEHKDLASEKSQLKEELKNVNDEEYIEEQARIQLKLIKPGEILYILEEDQNQKNENNNTKEKDKTNEESN